MDFYSSIACYYDEIFPLKKSQLEFVRGYLKGKDDLILDAGCGTGNLADALLKQNFEVIGADLDESMIEIARVKTQNKGEFHVCSLQNIADVVKNKGEVSVIACTGNTFVHINSEDGSNKFLKNCYELLKPGGVLIIQILNYDFILSCKLPRLPVIETDSIRFDRYYHYPEHGRHIDFEGVLTVKKENKRISEVIKLYPLKKQELIAKITDCGFSEYEIFGSFKKDPLDKNSLPLVMTAFKR
ncbi:MAG: hypothetical protein CSB55_06410 [Candidatus Cloacimonadota bacterium]|nr:MAG: hypothetical protein CSB55_06410 [Candidatus Cloacimonadota bacterium]